MKKGMYMTLAGLAVAVQALGQANGLSGVDWRRVERDSLPSEVAERLPYEQVVNHQPTDHRVRVVTNPFKDNWWVSGDVGIHTFQGDYSDYGTFRSTLSPDINLSVGKWFTPVWGLELQSGVGSSHGYTEQWTPYAVGSKDGPYHRPDGTAYWKLKTKWWDINSNVVINLSRLFRGWEGYDSDELFNQFKFVAGFGGIHHFEEPAGWGSPYGGPHNEWYGNVELRYSRYFSRSKSWSLDAKLRGRFYETHYDLSPIAGHRWDYHMGLQVGATYYFKARGWERLTPGGSVNYFVNIVPAPIIVQSKCPEYRTFTFYVFYPNNYSGRDDAPVVRGKAVNSMDYLAGGIYAQRRFRGKVSPDGVNLRRQKTEDIPTERATFTENPTGVVRGYEMTGEPMSLPMEAGAMELFAGIAGYYYSPIYMGNKTWHYRVDDETRTQRLLSPENYRETKSYGLNAHMGLETVRANMPVDEGSELYSFADVYAAIYGDEGYVSECADPEAVAAIREILESGRILHVQAEGLATSQDNYTGPDSEAVGEYRNRTLSHYRALSAIKWLQESGKFEGVSDGDFSLNTLSEPIGIVNDASTRELNAKLRRCARIKIIYVIEK